MNEINDPYRKANEIGVVGANEYRPYSVTGSIEDLKYDYRRVDDLSGRIDGQEIHVYSIDRLDRHVAEIVEQTSNGTFYTSVIFAERPNKREIASGFRVAAHPDFNW